MSNKKLILLFVTIVLLCFPAIIVQASENSNSLSTPSGIPLSELEQFIDEFMNEFIGTSVAGASVVIVENESIFYHGSFGYADMEAGILVDTDTVFEWGSIGKLFVWVSAMQLAEQGRLNLNTDIREYLPEGFLKKLQFDTPITMYHLMNHNAGWGVRTTDLMVFSSDDVVSLDEALRRFEPKQFFEPGTIVAYSNYGVAVAGYIIECITGQPFYEYVRENIFVPLGMNYTTAHPYQADNSTVAERRGNIRGHEQIDGIASPTGFDRVFTSLYPAGGAIGTSADMAKFTIALLDNSETNPLFKYPETRLTMFTNSFEIARHFPGITHGFWEGFYAERTLGHMGTLPTFTSNLRFSTESNFGLIVLTNGGSHELDGRLASALFGDFVPEEYVGTLPSVRNLNNIESSFFSTATATTGFARLLLSAPANILKIVDDNTINLMGFDFIQITPFIFYGTYQDMGAFAYLSAEDDMITKVTIYQSGRAPADFIPISGFDLFGFYLSVIFLAISLSFMITAAIIGIISILRGRKMDIPVPLAKKLTNALNIFGIIVFINYLIMLSRLPIVTQSELLPNFIINIAYMVFAPICIGFIFANMKKHESSKKSKLLYISSCVISIILIILMIVWDMYK